MPDIQLIHGNCLDILPTLPDCSVDSIVTDPPYDLTANKKGGTGIASQDLTTPYGRSRITAGGGFMGKEWDATGIAFNKDLWQECLRVLKPGGHLLAFGGTRTYHRMAVAIEDAGFEIRDSLHWIYGSGFPKSLDVSKAIEKQAGAEREVVGSVRTNVGMQGGNFSAGSKTADVEITAPATDAAKAWSGWGTALKPAHEPIVVARKPLVGTVAGNVLQFGTGAINIDGTRVGTEPMVREAGPAGIPPGHGNYVNNEKPRPFLERLEAAGRWPANIVFTHNHDCGDICTEGCPVRELDKQSGKVGGGNGLLIQAGDFGKNGRYNPAQGAMTQSYADVGGASRFFTVTEWDAPFRYVAKPGKRERNAGLDGLPNKPGGALEGNADHGNARKIGARPDVPVADTKNHHPTVKPLALMRWLVRLVTPPNGTVLEPFAGSGTTLVACQLEGFNAIGVEMTDEYLPIIEGRLEWARQQPPEPDNPQQELEL